MQVPSRTHLEMTPLTGTRRAALAAYESRQSPAGAASPLGLLSLQSLSTFVTRIGSIGSQAWHGRTLSLPRLSASGCEGGWRAEKRKVLMARALRHAGASRRANRDVCGIGPRFSSRVGNDFRLDTSASSWQGTPSGPGGSPDAARVLVATRPAGAAPRPAYRNASRERPLEGRGGYSLSEVREVVIVRG